MFAASAMLLGTSSLHAAVTGTASLGFSGFLTVTNYDASYLNGVRETNNMGTYALGFTNPTGDFTSLTSPLVGMCIEMQEAGYSSSALYQMTDLEDGQVTASNHGTAVTISTAKANLIREYWGRFYDDTWATSGNGYAANYTAMLFNMGLYEIFYDYDGSSLASLDLDADLHTIGRNSGSVPAADYNVINGWFSQLDGTSSYFANLKLLVHSGRQDFITELPPSTNLPEPATAVLMLMGAGMMFWKRGQHA
jgi:hypothetical protein